MSKRRNVTVFAMLAVAAFGLWLPASGAECPQERAIYSLNGATLTFEMNPKSMELGWGAVLRSPSAPVRLYSTISNGVAQAYLLSEDGAHWLRSEIELLDDEGSHRWADLGQPASPQLRLPGLGPKGTWRLTGCSAPPK